MSEKQFTARLANGKEMSFATAAEMVAWMEREKGLEYRTNPARGRRSKQNNRNRGNRIHRSGHDHSPARSGNPNRERRPGARSGDHDNASGGPNRRSSSLRTADNRLPLARFRPQSPDGNRVEADQAKRHQTEPLAERR